MAVKKFKSDVADTTISIIATNSLAIAEGEFVSQASGFATKTGAGVTIVGVSYTIKTFDSDNQTVKKEKVLVDTVDNKNNEFVIVADDTITQANEGSYFDINNTTQTVDVATASATTGQVQMVKFVGVSNSIYKVVNK